MLVFIKTLTEQTLSLEVNNENTIHNVMELISLQLDIPIDEQRLYFSGKQLDANLTLQHYQITHNNTLHLSLRLLGGMASGCTSGCYTYNTGGGCDCDDWWGVGDCDCDDTAVACTAGCTEGCSSCPDGQYSSNKLCTSDGYVTSGCYWCSTCVAGSYETVPCTDTSNRECAWCSTCPAGTYETVPCTATSNRVCAPCTVCTAPTTYMVSDCTATADRVCNYPYGYQSMTHFPVKFGLGINDWLIKNEQRIYPGMSSINKDFSGQNFAQLILNKDTVGDQDEDSDTPPEYTTWNTNGSTYSRITDNYVKTSFDAQYLVLTKTVPEVEEPWWGRDELLVGEGTTLDTFCGGDSCSQVLGTALNDIAKLPDMSGSDLSSCNFTGAKFYLENLIGLTAKWIEPEDNTAPLYFGVTQGYCYNGCVGKDVFYINDLKQKLNGCSGRLCGLGTDVPHSGGGVHYDEKGLVATDILAAETGGEGASAQKILDDYVFDPIGVNLSSATLTDCNFTNADLRKTDLTNATLTNANLTNATLTGADLTNADLTGANLTGVDFTDVILTGATFTRNTLTDVILTKEVFFEFIDSIDNLNIEKTNLQNEKTTLQNQLTTAVQNYTKELNLKETELDTRDLQLKQRETELNKTKVNQDNKDTQLNQKEASLNFKEQQLMGNWTGGKYTVFTGQSFTIPELNITYNMDDNKFE